MKVMQDVIFGKSLKQLVFPIVSVLSILVLIGLSIYENMDFIFPFHEAYFWMKFNLSNASLLQKIFDYRFTETLDPQKVMRFREVASLFNLLDVQFMYRLAQIGMPHFLSATFYISVVAIISMNILFTYKYISKRFVWLSLLLSLIYITSPTIFWGGFYFRSSKILAALGISIMMWMLFFAKRAYMGGRKLRFGLIFGLWLTALLSMLADEQSIFAVLIIFTISSMYFFGTLSKTFYKTSAALFLAGIGVILYRTIIAPWIILRVVGSLAPIYSANDPRIANNLLNPAQIFLTLKLFLRYAATSLGNIPTFAASIPLLAMVILARKSERMEDKVRIEGKLRYWRLLLISPLVITLTALVGIFCFLHVALLKSNFNLMARPLDSLRYYPTPTVTAWFIGASLILYSFVSKYSRSLVVLEFILVGILLLNIAAIPVHKRFLIIPENINGTRYGDSWRILDAIKSPQIPIESFGLDFQAILVANVMREKLHQR